MTTDVRTIHSAGGNSISIAIGVPRLKEILGASEIISTPIISTLLDKDDDPEYARQVKGRIEKSTLGEVTQYLEEVYGPTGCFIRIQLDINRIRLLKLEVDAESIKRSICTSDLKTLVKPDDVTICEESLIIVRPGTSRTTSPYHALQILKMNLPKVVIKVLWRLF